MVKFVVITGGVLSGIGKGVIASSTGSSAVDCAAAPAPHEISRARPPRPAPLALVPP